jgi:hypothetical protein
MDEYVSVFIHFSLTTIQYRAIITTSQRQMSSELKLKGNKK